MSNDRRYPYRYDRSATAGDLQARFASLAPGSGSGSSARVAGRIKTTRSHGKVAFADLEDYSGRIQLFADQGVLGEDRMEEFSSLNVGDVVGAGGEVVRTRRGELSIRVSTVELLAKCLRPMPEKWHGMSDVEARYRQRYLDLLVNPHARRVLEARVEAIRTIRRFFDERGFVEVETPLLHPSAGGAVARPFVTHHRALDVDLFLRIAPELYLKRLLIGGVERVYELNKSFRNEGLSARHLSEFTMLEAYEAYVDYNDAMTLVESLVRTIAERLDPSLEVRVDAHSVDLSKPFRRVTMFEAIAEATGRRLETVWKQKDWTKLADEARDLGVATERSWAPGKVLAEIFEVRAERTLVDPTFVVGFPKDVSPLAKDHREIEGFTEHADLVFGGVEMAAIYSELNDPDEQRARFRQQGAARAAGEDEAHVPDEEFVEALEYGMPPAGGVGVGIDRLLTVLLGEDSIREVILFPPLRPVP